MIPTEIKRALDNGITQEEIIEISTTLAFFIGWKAASEAVQGIIQVFRDLYNLYSISSYLWATSPKFIINPIRA
tara:strand:- start:5958 stop:6179 length:222 start_codon:yes stop_codon:yes gene_type:complete